MEEGHSQGEYWPAAPAEGQSARRQISWASMAELETEIPGAKPFPLDGDSLPPIDVSLKRNGAAKHADSHGSKKAPADPSPSQRLTPGANAVPSVDSFLHRQKPTMTWASIVDREDNWEHASAARCVSEGIPQSVSWADEIEVHHDGPSREACESVFQFDGDADNGASDLVQSLLDDMLEKMGLSPLPDDDLCLHRHELFLNKYKRSKLLGEGTYGEVWSCIRTEDGKDGFAVKFVEKRDAWAISDVLREINILARLRGCPHIVHYYECFDEAARMAIVTEEVAGESLLYYLDDHGALSEQQAAAVVADVAEALSYSHSMGIAHRDIKPANVLCCRRHEPAPCKVADFGLSHMTLSATTPALKTPVGTLQYLSPEVVEVWADGEGSLSYTKKCDIWALGVMMYLMLCNYPPFLSDVDCGENCGFAEHGSPCDACSDQLMRNIQRGHVDFPYDDWCQISDDAIDLIMGMMCKDTDQRMSAAEVLSHPWIVMGGASPSGKQRANSERLLRPSGGSARSSVQSLRRASSPLGIAHIPPAESVQCLLGASSSPKRPTQVLSPLVSPAKQGSLSKRMEQESQMSLLQRRLRRNSHTSDPHLAGS